MSIFAAVIAVFSLWKHIPPADGWMIQQINEDLSRFANQKVSREKIKQIADDSANDGCLFVHFKIRKNQVTITHHISATHFLAKDCLFPRINAIKNSLSQVVKKYPLPDMDFIVSIHDALQVAYDIPLFVMAKIDRFDNQILIPDFEALRGRYQVLESQDITQDSSIPPWNQRKPKLFWRGGPGQHSPEGFPVSLNPNDFHCLSRVKLCHMSSQYPEMIDARFSYLGSQKEALSQYFGDFISFEDQLFFKYQMLIDGFSCSYSTSGWRLFSDSVIFKEDSNHYQWYYKQLKPFVHYIPVKEGLDDLVERLQWAMTHDDEARKIARQAREFALKNITQDKNRLYLYYALLAYSKLNWAE